MSKMNDLMARVDSALADSNLFSRQPDKAAELARQRSELESALVAAEA